jgi:hypothetical protein
MMMSRSVVLGTTAIVLALASGTVHADKSVPIWEKSPEDQYSYFDHVELSVGAAMLDQYGDKISDFGRWGYVDKCLDGSAKQQGRETEAVHWALCGDELKALDIEKLKEYFTKIADRRPQKVIDMKKAGAELEAEAKTEPGLMAILKQVEAAKGDWKTFEAANHDAIVLYQKLKDGARTSKSNAPQFEGCWEATQPAFAKAVRATKFTWDNAGDDEPGGRIEELVTNPVTYYATANFAMCAYAAHATGAVLAGAAMSARGGVFGWRTMLISKYVDPKFKPKFTDRGMSWRTGEHGTAQYFNRGSGTDVSFPWPEGAGMKMHVGVVKKMKKDGEDTLLQFKGVVAEECVDWKETGKIRTWDTAGDPVYERKCLKRAKREQDAPDDATMATKLLDGVAVGSAVALIGNFPEEVYDVKKKKFISILGVSVKGSPAETPIKE